MSEYHNQQYTKEEINVILQKIKGCVNAQKYTISKGPNRFENDQLKREYNLTSSRQKEILLGLDVIDFCHSLKNTNPGYEYEILYVFCLQRDLFNISGEEESVDIYIKFNIIEDAVDDYVIVISLHKRNKPIDYAFR